MPSLLLLGGAAILAAAAPASVTFDDDLAFLRRHTSVIVLGEASGPRIAVDPPSFDFGRTLPQKAVTREFNLRNFGDQDLVIETVSTSCGCTVADDLAKKVIKPGGSLPLRVTLTTPAGPGPITKSVVVRSNDRSRPLLEIQLKTTVAAAAR